MSNAASETLDGSLAASAGASRDKGQIIDPNGLDLFRLTMMVITASICGGIFALAGDMAAGGASTGAVLISWAICFVGVFSLMMCFNGLSLRGSRIRRLRRVQLRMGLLGVGVPVERVVRHPAVLGAGVLLPSV